LQAAVGDQGDQGGGDPGRAAHPARYERVAGAGVGDAAGHCDVPGREDREDHGDDQECGGDRGQPGGLVRGRDDPSGDGERGDAG